MLKTIRWSVTTVPLWVGGVGSWKQPPQARASRTVAATERTPAAVAETKAWMRMADPPRRAVSTLWATRQNAGAQGNSVYETPHADHGSARDGTAAGVSASPGVYLSSAATVTCSRSAE